MTAMNLRSLSPFALAALLLANACSSAECVKAADCADGMVCEAEKCVAAPAPSGCSPACSGATPVCDLATRSCITCTATEGCAEGLVCDTSFRGGRCVGCQGDGDCSGATPHCEGTTSSCVACTLDEHCSGTTPVCDPSGHRCVGCADDSDCAAPTPYCDPAAKSCVACLDPNGCDAVLAVIGATSGSTTEVVVEFARLVDPVSVTADGSQFTFTGGLTASAAAATGKLVRVTTSAQTPGATYTVSVAHSVYDLEGATVAAGSDTAEFTTPQTQARLIINEVNPNIPNSRDLIEFLVVEAGTTKKMTLVMEGKTDDPSTLATFPDVAMQVGDLVVLHLNPVDANDPKASERQSKSESTASEAYPNAWDFVGGSEHVVFSNRLLKLVAADGTVQDVVPFVKSDAVAPLPGGYETAVQIAQDEGQWLPADCDGVDCTYTSSPSVLDVSVDWKGLAEEGGNAKTASMSRVAGPDTDTKADWVLKLTGASFGSPNP
jgi:hypothetical protein